MSSNQHLKSRQNNYSYVVQLIALCAIQMSSYRNVFRQSNHEEKENQFNKLIINVNIA